MDTSNDAASAVAPPEPDERADGLRHRSSQRESAWEPFRGPFERWPHITDFMLATLSFLLTLALWSQAPGMAGLPVDTLADIGTFLFVVAGNFALLWRRSHPLTVHAVVLVCCVFVQIGSMQGGIFALVFSLYSLGRYAADDHASLIGMLAALTFIATDLFILSTPSIGGTIAAGLVMVLWYVGRRLRFRGEYLRLLEERAAALEREKNIEAERAVAEERTRIAQEMHDIVAHQVSLMTVQAGAAKTVSQSDPEAAREAMGAVENAGREAMTEMRQLLSVLRPANGGEHLAPQPGIADIPALVRKVNRAGPEVHLQTKGPLSGLPARLDLTAYRIVQEALTNVLKHAGAGARAEVSLSADTEAVRISVTDNGEGSQDQPGSGHGIAGMRERVALLGGILNAGPASGDNGFIIEACLPLTAEVS